MSYDQFQLASDYQDEDISPSFVQLRVHKRSSGFKPEDVDKCIAYCFGGLVVFICMWLLINSEQNKRRPIFKE